MVSWNESNDFHNNLIPQWARCRTTHRSENILHRYHDDVIKWKHFPRYWSFARGIPCDRWISLTKASDARLDVFFDLRLKKRLSKQSWSWWFETPSRPLWHHCNVLCWTTYSILKRNHIWFVVIYSVPCNLQTVELILLDNTQRLKLFLMMLSYLSVCANMSCIMYCVNVQSLVCIYCIFVTGLHYLSVCMQYSLWCLRQHDTETSGPRLNIKTVLCTYGDFHVKDKTAVRTSYL